MLKTLMEKLMIDGADVHAVMFLIALMYYNGHSRAVDPTSSLARQPEGIQLMRRQKGGESHPAGGIFALVAGIDTLTRSGYVFSETSRLRCDKI
jgi:hypothetical protein